jgi:hypothetical protein
VLAEIDRVVGARLNPRVMFLESLKQIAAQCDRQLAAVTAGGIAAAARAALEISA